MFFGAQKFRDYIHEHDPMIKGDVIICFDPNESFKVQYMQIAVKPITVIAFTQEGKEEVVSHRELIQMCQGAQPFVCLKPGYAMINKNKKIQALILQEPITSFSGYSYSPCSTYFNLNEKTINMILQARVNDENQ